MSLLTTLADRATYALRGPGAGRKAAWDLVPIGVQGRAQYPATDPETLLGVYRRNELVYAAINRRARSAIGPRLLVQERVGPDKWAEIPGHPFRRLWMRPNAVMDEASLVVAWIVSSDISGIFYGELVRAAPTARGVLGAPVAIHPLNPAKIGVVPNAQNLPDHYEFRDGQHEVAIPAANMLAYRDYDPANPTWGGLSRLAVCLGTVDADNAQTDFVRAFFNNGGVISGILKVKGTYTQEQADALRGKWRDRYGRQWGRQHDVAVLDDNAEYQQIGTDPSHLESEVLRSISESRIVMTFDVPPLIIYAYVGLLRATYSNLKEAWRGFWEATLYPLYEQLRVWLTWNLLTEYEDPERLFAEQIRLHWDFSRVPWLQEDTTAAHTRAGEAFAKGGMSINEYRTVLGLDPLPADYFIRSLAQVEVPVLTAGEDSSAGKGLWLPRAYKGRVARDRSQIEDAIARAAAGYLRTEYDRAAAAVEAE